MITEEGALAQILDAVRRLPPRTVPLTDALNRFAAEDYVAQIPLPNFDNSAMDGYAVIAADCAAGKALSVVGEQPAGKDRGLTVSRGSAVRIFTGAPIPIGADAVVMQEEVRANGSEIIVDGAVEPGEFIRPRGCDLAEGQKVIGKGERLRSTKIAALAAQGVTKLLVGGNVTAAVISTGDEVVQPGRPLQPGEIYDSNSILLKNLLGETGADVRLVGHSPDEMNALVASLRRAAENDVVLICGGVSVGQHDLVKTALAAIGAEINLWRVAIKPGKPFLFGRAGDSHIFGLPGNPVSSFVTFLKFVRPAVLRLMGAADPELGLRRVPARLAEEAVGDPDRPHYIRGCLADGVFRPVGRQESHAVFGLSKANALLRVPAKQTFRAGEMVKVEIWD